MRLEKLQSYIEEKGWKQEYTEEGGCGSLDFEHRGLSYHVWEFQEDGYGAESNVENVGRRIVDNRVGGIVQGDFSTWVWMEPVFFHKKMWRVFLGAD